MRTSFYGIVLLLLVGLPSCNQLPPAEYIAYVANADNGLFKTTSDGNYLFSCKYLPSDWDAAIAGNRGMKKQKSDEQIGYAFTLRIQQLNTKANPISLGELAIKNALRLTAGLQNEHPISVLAVAGMSHEIRDYIVEFNVKNNSSDLLLELNEVEGLFGKQQFLFEKEKINKIPSLKI